MRIVSLLPSATEIVCALGLREALVGVTHDCDFPAEVRGLPRVTRLLLAGGRARGESRSAAIDRKVKETLHAGASLYHVDVDAIERLEPDLIVTQQSCSVCFVAPETVALATDRMKGHPQVVFLEPRSLADVYANIRTVAVAAGVAQRGEALVSALRARAEAVVRLTSTQAKRRATVLIWTDPLMGSGQWTPELVELAGGVPVVSFPGADARAIAWEQLESADPEVVIVALPGMRPRAARAAVEDLRRTAPRWEAFAARRRVVLIDGHWYANRPSPRLIDTIELFASAIHPEVVDARGLDALAIL
ncbi:MAG: ABC transporter substrate-binding protein [Vulcanimicrobiaceae bacterium]